MEYEHQRLNIETPQGSLATKEVNNYANIVKAAYAERIDRRLFLGARLFFEQASENGVRYCIPLRRRFASVGIKEPYFFVLYRLRHQKEEHGLIDLHLSYSPYLGQREIGQENSNRLRGRDTLVTTFSHGLWEEEWEFRSALGISYFGNGKEHSSYTHSSYELDDYLEGDFTFTSQYRYGPWFFIYGSVGVIYSGVEKIREEGGSCREIKAGTGSRFEVGMKRPLTQWSLLELSYTLKRYEYFVKSFDANLEGDAIRQQFQLNYKMAF